MKDAIDAEEQAQWLSKRVSEEDLEVRFLRKSLNTSHVNRVSLQCVSDPLLSTHLALGRGEVSSDR